MQPHAVVSRGVAGRRLVSDTGHHFRVRRHEFQVPGIDDRLERLFLNEFRLVRQARRIGQESPRDGIFVAGCDGIGILVVRRDQLTGVALVFVSYQHQSRIRKGRDPATFAVPHRAPADVVEMEVGAEDDVDVIAFTV